MSSVNKHIIVGNVGKTPEKRSFSNGGSVVNFSLATTKTWRDKQSGEKREQTAWHNIACFNENLGKVIENYVDKGSKVYIEGEVITRKFQDRDGNDRYSTETVIPKFGGVLVLLDSRGSDGQSGGAPNDDYQRPQQQSQSFELDDEIPF